MIGILGGGYRLSKGPQGWLKIKSTLKAQQQNHCCWPLFLRTSKLEVAPGVGCIGSRANTGLAVFLVTFKPTSPLSTLIPAFWGCVILLQFAGFLHTELRKIACSRPFIDLQSGGFEALTQACRSKVCALDLYRLGPRNAQNFLGELLAMVLVICWQIFNNQLSGRKRN